MAIRWLLGGVVRAFFGKRSISVRGEAGAPLRFRPGESPNLLRGIRHMDPRVRKEWEMLLRPGETVLDVGANIGLTVQRVFSILDGQCDILAFEPIPRNVELLRENVQSLGSARITVIPSAVGDSDGTALFCDNLKHGALSRSASHLTDDNNRWPLFWKQYTQVEVGMTTLDTFLADRPDAHPSFIKIDVEGSGADVLSGARHTLDRFKPVISSEFHGDEEREGMIRLLRDSGYRGIDFHEEGFLTWCDAGESKGSFLHPTDPRIPGLEFGKC